MLEPYYRAQEVFGKVFDEFGQVGFCGEVDVCERGVDVAVHVGVEGDEDGEVGGGADCAESESRGGVWVGHFGDFIFLVMERDRAVMKF